MAAESVYIPSKTCKDCQQTLPLDAFWKHDRTRDGRSIYCKECASARHKKWRENPENRKRATENWNRFDAKSRGFAGFIRSCTPCQLCGETKATLLDFHHIDPATKEMEVSQAKGLQAVIDEAQKCTILCKTCHKGLHGGTLDGSSLELLSFEYIDARFTEYARDFTMKNG